MSLDVGRSTTVKRQSSRRKATHLLSAHRHDGGRERGLSFAGAGGVGVEAAATFEEEVTRRIFEEDESSTNNKIGLFQYYRRF